MLETVDDLTLAEANEIDVLRHQWLGKDNLKLDLGSGAGRRDEDYITVDLHTAADVRCSVDALPFDDNSAVAIWSAHTLEHIQSNKIHSTLKEWFRVLKPGHRAIIQVPNFDYVARYWLTGPDRNWAEQMVFGQQIHPGEFHKSAFTSATLKADLEAAGFEVLRVDVRWTHMQETLQAVARKK